MTMLVSEKNRLGTASGAVSPRAVSPRIEAHIAWLEQELSDLDKGLRQTLRRSPVWREKDDLLRTVPGVGPQLSLTLLAHLLSRVNYICRSCCLIEKCYRNFSTWGPSRPALIPALQRVPPWAHQPWRRPAFWP